jgi:hypothetical protein
MPNALKNHSLMNTFTKISTKNCKNKLQKQNYFKIFTVKYHWHKDCLRDYWSPKIISFPLPLKQVLKTGFLIRQKFSYAIMCYTYCICTILYTHCCFEINSPKDNKLC